MLKFQKFIERFQVEYHFIITITFDPCKNSGNIIIGFSSSVYNNTLLRSLEISASAVSVYTGEKFKGGTN